MMSKSFFFLFQHPLEVKSILGKRRKPPTTEDDEKIISLSKQFGCNYHAIAEQMPGWTIRQVRNRIKNVLVHMEDRKLWSNQEDDLLIKEVAKVGKNWDLISKFFPSRSTNDIRNRYTCLEKTKLHSNAPLENNDLNEEVEKQLSRDIIDVEDTLRPIMDDIVSQQDNPIVPQPDNPTNLNYSPQLRKDQLKTTVQQASYNLNMKKFSCYQNGQIPVQKYRAITGSEHPVCVDSTIGDYHLEKEIGKGSFSSVALASKEGTNEKFAIKIIPMEPIRKAHLEQLILNEIEILQNLDDHPNIIKYYEHFETPNYIIIVTEYCPKTLLQYINERNNNEEDIIRIAFGIISGLNYIHQSQISHLDIKIENILLDKDMNPKICDFGYSRDCSVSEIDKVPPLTATYAAPEAFLKEIVNLFKLDVYALGITLYMLSTGDAAFYKVRDFAKIRERTLKEELPIDPKNKLQRLAARCAIKDLDDRPSVEEILEEFVEEFGSYY